MDPSTRRFLVYGVISRPLCVSHFTTYCQDKGDRKRVYLRHKFRYFGVWPTSFSVHFMILASL